MHRKSGFFEAKNKDISGTSRLVHNTRGPFKSRLYFTLNLPYDSSSIFKIIL